MLFQRMNGRKKPQQHETDMIYPVADADCYKKQNIHSGVQEKMVTIKTLELTDESVYPDEQALRSVLSRSYNAYCKLLELLKDNGMEYEWRYYRDGKAWLCKVVKKKRTIVWMSAWKGFIQATIYFPVKYLNEIYSLDIGEDTKNRIRETKNTGKSKPCIFRINGVQILKDFEKIIQFKCKIK